MQLKTTLLDLAMPLGLTPYAISVQYKPDAICIANYCTCNTPVNFCYSVLDGLAGIKKTTSLFTDSFLSIPKN